MEQSRAGDAPDNESEGECSEQDAGEDAGQKALSPCWGGWLRLNDGSHSYAHRLEEKKTRSASSSAPPKANAKAPILIAMELMLPGHVTYFCSHQELSIEEGPI